MKSDSARPELKREEALDLYYFMRLNRSLDELLVRLFRQNKIVGGLYGSLGQEATSIGTAYALAKGDWIAPLIRNVGSLLVRGFKPRDIMTQYMARATSPTSVTFGLSFTTTHSSVTERTAATSAAAADPVAGSSGLFTASISSMRPSG